MATLSNSSAQNIGDGLSTSSTNDSNADGPVSWVSVSDSGTTPSDPTAAMAQQKASQSLSRLVFPADTPPYYFKIDIASYKRTSWREVGHLNPTHSIILPIPGNIVDTQQVEWDKTELGLAGSIAMNGLNSLAGGKGVAAAAKSIASRELGQLGSATVEGLTDGLMISQGLAFNNYLTMMLKGPVYKQHQFDWVLRPRNSSESAVLQSLRPLLMNSQAPGLADDGFFYTYPCVFTLTLCHESVDLSSILYKFKPCVMTTCSFAFAPNSGIPAFFGDTQAPQSVKVQMQFVELELWLAGDYASNALEIGG